MTHKKDQTTMFLIYTVIIILCLATIYPFIHCLLLSVSPQGYTFDRGINGFIDGMDTMSWKMIISSTYMWKGFNNSIVRVVLGTLVAVLLQSTFAYPLSKRKFIGSRFFNILIVTSTVLTAGLIPNYMLVKNLGIMDSIWALILPGCISGFNVIVLKNFFLTIPESLEEAAKIDGANDIYIFFKIVVPISLPSLATITLWTVVSNWNAWFDVILYISSRNKFLLPAILREIIVDNKLDSSFTQTAAGSLVPNTESMKAASTMFVMFPVLIVYPFLQRFFVTGLTVGAVKG